MSWNTAACPGGVWAELAGEIGSDVGFFIYGMGVPLHRTRGKGGAPAGMEGMAPPDRSAEAVVRRFHARTPTAAGPVQGNCRAYRTGSSGWTAHVLVNDLERPVFEKHLFLAEMKRWLLERPGVRGAMMSGSGSTMFAVAEDEEAARKLMEDAARELDPTLWMWSGLVMREGAGKNMVVQEALP